MSSYGAFVSKTDLKDLSGLGVPLDLAPMEALLVTELPGGDGWQFEPKWDGFRCLAFRAGRSVELRAKSGKSLTRFFPEMVDRLRALPGNSLVIDGELVIPTQGTLSFDALQQRLHPAESRIQRLASETPATLVAFDLLLRRRGRPLLDAPFRERRAALEDIWTASTLPGLWLTAFARSAGAARRWLSSRKVPLDGVVAKRLDLPYLPGERAMLKVKRRRTADCVVGGFRYESARQVVGSLLLGLYDRDGLLHHVGFTSALSDQEKPKLTSKLERLIEPPGFTGNAPGGPSRWSTARSAAWQPLRSQLVVEVAYDHVSDQRFRHGTRLIRWRPDKAPRQCTLEQIAVPKSSLRALEGLRCS